MTTFAVNRTVLILCLVTLLATPLSREVFAQVDEENSIDTTATTTDETASSTGPSVVTVQEEEEPWFKRERIFGNINVGDFVVGPGRTEIELAPGETVVQEISVTNRISEDRKFMLEIEDIVGSPSGEFSASLTGGTDSPYSIEEYISYPDDEFILSLGERARIPITITIPPNAEPGGYYGSVLVSTVRVGQEGTTSVAPRSPIVARVGSLFFIRVKGDIETGGETKEVKLIDDKWWYESGPVNIGVVYENTGSVHLNPYGELSVTNMLGEEVGFVELEPWFVLPKSLRVREITWDREFLLGRYTVTVKVNRGYEDIVDEMTVSFWVLPWRIVGGVFLVLFIVIFSIRAFFRTFEFKRK